MHTGTHDSNEQDWAVAAAGRGVTRRIAPEGTGPVRTHLATWRAARRSCIARAARPDSDASRARRQHARHQAALHRALLEREGGSLRSA